MSEHRASISWESQDDDFSYKNYSRDHAWRFGEIAVAASAAPEYFGSAERVDPEEAFVAAVASCHMLTFLALASRKRLPVLSYQDAAVGFLEKNASGALAITRVELRPEIVFAEGVQVSPENIDKMHERSHHECFIANSVTAKITVESVN